jgi:hypothetical protein
MALPQEIKADISGNALNGIIYSLKTKYNITNPIESGYIIPSASNTEGGDIKNTIVGWQQTCWYTSLTYPPLYYQVYFPRGQIEVTGYSLRGCPGMCFPTNWKVYAFHEENMNNESSWDVLGDNISSASQPYCYTTSTNCQTYDTGTFTVKRTNKFYKYVRFVMTGGSCYSYTKGRFISSGFDIFGTLSFLTNPYIQTQKINQNTCIRRITSPDVVYIIIGMSLMQS